MAWVLEGCSMAIEAAFQVGSCSWVGLDSLEDLNQPNILDDFEKRGYGEEIQEGKGKIKGKGK